MAEKQDVRINNKRKVPKRFFIGLAIVIVVLLINIISLRYDYITIKEIGQNYLEVFKQNCTYRYTIMLGTFVVSYIVVYSTNKIIRVGIKKFFQDDKKEMPKLPNKTIALAISLIVAMLAGTLITENVMLAANTAWFGINDPVFGTDIGYYIFNKPLVEQLLFYALIIVGFLAIYTALYYVIALNTYLDGIYVETLKKNAFIKQLIFYLILFVILVSVLNFVKTQDILVGDMIAINDEEQTILTGASFSDANIQLWGYRILSFVFIIALIIVLHAFRKKSFKIGVTGVAIVPAYLLILFVVMTYFQYIYIGKDELDKEKNYIEHHISATKNAYAINIDEKELGQYETTTYDQVRNNADVLKNIPIISEDVTEKNLSEYQDNNGYYTYPTIRIANYKIDGINRLLYIAPRNIENEINRTHNNKTYEYTHGYGIIATSASSTDKNGGIEYVQLGFNEENQKIKISQPRTYYSTGSNTTCIVNTNDFEEYDYPSTSSTFQKNTYDGDGGISLNFWDRLVIGIKQKNLKLAFTTSVNKNSKVLINKNITERAKTVMPYLEYDENPYLVVTNEGKIVWVLDAYTISSKYPYSQMTEVQKENGETLKLNYIRNSVKVLIDAYNGDIKFYITDRTDPIVMAYNNIYPGLFENQNERISEDISEHFTYPQLLYKIQSSMLETYHNTTVEVLYRADDLWKLATDTVATSSNNSKTTSKVNKMEPYYTMLKTIDNNESSLGLVALYSKLNKQNLCSYLVGSYEEGKAKLTLYKFAADSNVAGLTQLNNQIIQDETILSKLETINTTGTKTIKEMMIIPIENTLLYVMPVYQILLNEESQVPVLKKVIVASGNKVTIGDTLDEAVNNLLSEEAIDFDIVDLEDMNAVIDSIIKANQNLKNSSNDSDWEIIGQDINSLQSLIDQLEVLRQEEILRDANEKVITNVSTDSGTENAVNNSVANWFSE